MKGFAGEWRKNQLDWGHYGGSPRARHVDGVRVVGGERTPIRILDMNVTPGDGDWGEDRRVYRLSRVDYEPGDGEKLESVSLVELERGERRGTFSFGERRDIPWREIVGSSEFRLPEERTVGERWGGLGERLSLRQRKVN